MTNQQNGELVMIICALLHPTAFAPVFCIKSLNTLSFDEKHVIRISWVGIIQAFN